eukprot:6181639-Pleurochrysis_carterae.AAC.2
MSQRSQKSTTVLPGKTSPELTPEAQQALEVVGAFAKNFLPLLFNVHQAEPPEKRRQLQVNARDPRSTAAPRLASEQVVLVLP